SYLQLPQSADQSSSRSFSILGVCKMLDSMVDQLAILGHSLKIVLEKAFEVKHNEKKMLEVFAIDDHIMLMKMVLSNFSKQSEVAPDAQAKITIENMINDTKSLIKMAEDPSLFSTPSATDVPTSKMNVGHSSNNQSLLYGIDVMKAARLTFKKKTSYIIEHIKNELENLGTTPTKEIVSRLALELSYNHFKMAGFNNGSFNSVGYDHGSSSPSMNTQGRSIDYGLNNAEALASFDTVINLDKDADTNRTCFQPDWEKRNRNPSPPHTTTCNAGQVEGSSPTPVANISEAQGWPQFQDSDMAQMGHQEQIPVMPLVLSPTPIQPPSLGI
ncbi:unnamed protein product, partial [Meganyctiphanes norvegica]